MEILKLNEDGNLSEFERKFVKTHIAGGVMIDGTMVIDRGSITISKKDSDTYEILLKEKETDFDRAARFVGYFGVEDSYMYVAESRELCISKSNGKGFNTIVFDILEQ